MEAKIERCIKKALAVHKAHALAAINQQHLTAAAPPDAFNLNSWDSSVSDEILPAVSDEMQTLAERVTSFLQLSPEKRAELLGKIDVDSRTANFVDKVKTIGDDISAQLMDELAVGIGKGEGTEVLRRRIAEVFRIGDNTARRIVRTETHGAAEATTHASADVIANSGYVVTKTWVATMNGDGRTRPEHEDADGQTVDQSEPFNVGGEDLMFPGDPDGSAENVINCRCSTSFAMPDSALGPSDSGDMPDS